MIYGGNTEGVPHSRRRANARLNLDESSIELAESCWKKEIKSMLVSQILFIEMNLSNMGGKRTHIICDDLIAQRATLTSTKYQKVRSLIQAES